MSENGEYLSMNAKQRDGYSLVEVSLALLVAGLGVMTAFALFPEALGQSRKSVEATEVATFADFVFASLTERAGLTNETAWDGLESIPLDKTAALLWTDQPAVETANPGNYKNCWWKPDYYGNSESAYIANYRVASFTYTLQIVDPGTGGRVKEARLEVWAGDIPTPPTTPGKVFYREFAPLR